MAGLKCCLQEMLSTKTEIAAGPGFRTFSYGFQTFWDGFRMFSDGFRTFFDGFRKFSDGFQTFFRRLLAIVDGVSPTAHTRFFFHFFWAR